jgi:O-antigen/teichoic acid export membrane protein
MALLAGLLSSVVLARFMGPSEYGVYAYIFAIISILALPAQMGTPTLVVRETARAMAEQDWSAMRGIWRWAVVVILVGSAIITGIAVLGFHFFWTGESYSRYHALWWGLPLIPLLGLSSAAAAALLGLKRVVLAQFPDQILRPVLLAISLAVVSTIYPPGATAPTALALLCTTLTFTLALTVLFLGQVRPEALKQCARIRMENRKWIAAILPLSLIAGLQLVSQNTDLLMLGFFRTNEEVGLYKIALSISSLTIVGLTTFNMVMQPYIAELYQNQRVDKLQAIISLGAAAAIAITTPIVAIFILAGEQLISFVYGGAYSGASTALVILSIGSVSTAYFGVAGVLLTMVGLEKFVLGLLFVSTCSNILLNAWLIPKFGMAGAATATAFSTFIFNLLLWQKAKAHTNFDCSPKKVVEMMVEFLSDRLHQYWHPRK